LHSMPSVWEHMSGMTLRLISDTPVWIDC
jgi:hypothetical protein